MGVEPGPRQRCGPCAPLTPETRGMIGTKELGRKTSSATVPRGSQRGSSGGPAGEHDGTIRGPIQGSFSANSALMQRPRNRQ
jgi:hypothetical protein